MSLTHLETHSYFSFLEGVPSPEDLIQSAIAHNMDCLALTDTNGYYGIIPYYKKCEKAGIRPILGTQIKKDDRSVTLLARTKRGFTEISRFITDFHLKDDFNIAGSLSELSDNVVIITADEYYLRTLNRRKSRFYIFIADYRWNSEKGRLMSARNRRLSEELKLPRIAVNDVHFISPEDYEEQLLLTAIRNNTTIERLPEKDKIERDCYFSSINEMQERYGNDSQPLENAEKIARSCDVVFTLGKFHLPVFAPYKDSTR